MDVTTRPIRIKLILFNYNSCLKFVCCKKNNNNNEGAKIMRFYHHRIHNRNSNLDLV